MAYFNRYGAEPESPEQARAKAELESRLLAAVQQMHDTIAKAKDVVYGTSSTESLVKITLLSAPFVGPLIGVTAAAIVAWIYDDKPSTEEVKDSIINGLNAIDRGVVGRLHGEIPSVLAGKIAPEKWTAAYNEVIKGVASQLDELGQTTLAAHIRQEKEQILKGISLVVSTVTSVAKAAATPLFAAIGVVLGLYIISWLPKKGH